MEKFSGHDSELVGQFVTIDSRPEFIPTTAPYLRTVSPYDHLGFWDFPSRVGWKTNREDRDCHSGRCPPGICTTGLVYSRAPQLYGMNSPAVSKVDNAEFSTNEKLAFLQSWLFFGALNELCSLCGLAIDIEETFVIHDNVTTAPLNGFARKLFIASRSHCPEAHPEWKDKLRRLARHIRLIITRPGDEDEGTYTFDNCLVLYSINILQRAVLLVLVSYSLLVSYSRSWNITVEDHRRIYAIINTRWPQEGQLTIIRLMFNDRGLPQGWCSSSELDNMDMRARVFAYFLDRPHAPRDHTNCTKLQCLAMQTDETNYKTTHVSATCTCPFISVDPEKLRDVLAKNRIPKIVISETGELTVIDEEEHPYVAISHTPSLGADGLGNPFENSLPRCQLLRLRSATKRFRTSQHHESPALWMDTLCIPVASHLKNYRKLAIQLIAKTFREATATLVLDKSLYTIDFQKISNQELAIRICFGGWMKRIWTLQEAVFTSDPSGGQEKLYFLMEQDIVYWETNFRAFASLGSSGTHPFFLEEREADHHDSLTITELRIDILFEDWIDSFMTDRLPSLQFFTDSELDETEGLTCRVMTLAEAFKNRATSRPEDEPICLASLVGLPLDVLLEITNAEDRMAKFYMLLYKIPKAIIFPHLPDKEEEATEPWCPFTLQKIPFRWAPASLASLPYLSTISLIYDCHRLDDKKYRGLGLCKSDGFHIHNEGLIMLNSHEALQSKCPLVLKDAGANKFHRLIWLKDSPGGLYHKLGFIFRDEDRKIDSSVAIVCIDEHSTDEDSEEFYVTIVGHGKLKDETDPHASGLSYDVMVEVKMLGPNQKWCIT